jgi:1-acyl-sn-glycerol-3-phosphate acyltransferase
MPIGYYGNENFSQNIRRLKRTEFNIAVGNPFRLNARGEVLSRHVREQMTEEIMYQLSALLPPQNRGVYADLNKATSTYLEFNEPGENNLLHAATSRENQEHILQYA